jgi:hypothetical protein
MRVKKYNLYNITSLYVIQVSDTLKMNMDSEDDHEDYPWADFFMALSNPYYGWVRGLEAAQAVVTEYSFATSTSYAIPRCTNFF